MAYDSNTGKITAPVSIADLQDCFGTTETYLSYIVDDVDINMWAKYKPVVRNGLIDTTGQINNISTNKTWKTSSSIESGGNLGASWWKGDDTNHGLSFPTYELRTFNSAGFINALTSLADSINGGKNGWTYTRPSGGSSSPYRLLDFLQYNHKAPKPVRTASSGTDTVYASSTQGWTFSINLMEVDVSNLSYDSRDFIVPTDIKVNWTNQVTLYLGIAIYKKSGNTYNAIAWSIGNTWNGIGILNSDNTQPDVDTTTSDTEAIAHFKSGNTYYALPVYFTHNDLTQQHDGMSFIGNSSSLFKIIPVPYVSFVPFQAIQRSQTQSIGKPVLSNNKVSRLDEYSTTLYIDAHSDEGYSGGTASSIRMAIVNELWNGTSASGNYAYDNTWSNVSVTANERTTVGSTNTLTLASTHTWKVIVWVIGERTDIALIQPAPLTPL